MSSNNGKRKEVEGAAELTGRDKKKLRMAEARAIPVQPPQASQAGPSKVVPTKNSLAGLPSAIDVERFAEARAFEINAMQTAMKTASAGSTQRAWQALPRHLRRRAASHDIRRVPLRLRARAKAEMDIAPKKSNTSSKRGKTKVITRTDSFLKRQRDKSWLETHLWHAKRMKMENVWGYRLAIEPTDKSYRPSHRAAVQGSIIHDASYYSIVELRGPENALVPMLELCCDPHKSLNPGQARYKKGARTLETHIYHPTSYPFGLIAPLSILWHPDVVEESDLSNGPITSKYTQALAGTVSYTQIPTNLSTRDRTIWLRFHPSVHEEILQALKGAISQFLAQNADGPEIQIQLTDLKDQINVFEIMGPKASQVIKGALSPVLSDQRPEFSKLWSTLGDIQSTGSLPRNMIIGFTVVDPRLKFPPKNAKPREQKGSDLSPFNLILPSVSLATSKIWDESVRLGLAKPRYQKKDIDTRRSKNPIPGTKLGALRHDDRVPVLLIQRSLEAQGEVSAGTEALHGWTLVIPSGWGMAFWSSLIFTGTRVAGQRERQVQAFEAGAAYFPRDYPCTPAYDAFSTTRMEKLKEDWERKPPAKRVNYEKFRVSSPWLPEWSKILGIPEPGSEDLITTQREASTTKLSPTMKPWLFRGQNVDTIVDSVSRSFNKGETFLCEINRIRSIASLEPLPRHVKGSDLLQGALVTVKVTMCGRGTPEDLAMIYAMEDGEVAEVLKSLHKPKLPERDSDDDGEGEEDMSLSNKVIGRITTGHYSLRRGAGFGVAVVPLVSLLELKGQVSRVRGSANVKRPPLVKIRNTNSRVFRGAQLELLLDGYR
ncbi:ribonuclease P/MRP protein subunit [Coprinopsis marcescibilis]|uniref:Ribonuclease P/MRP protein subunit n=1 Tax=Coprinopsis marcescibilis TaxID=230819 RepID=A0A5C3L5R2_COPMA|nr:ribonuclease P/MRP protein subunit [Coprinopsis marcescibilis]